eukprot:4517118-Amphidinium_carterae.1
MAALEPQKRLMTFMLELTGFASEAVRLHKCIGGEGRREHAILDMIKASRENGEFVKFLTEMHDMLAGGKTWIPLAEDEYNASC